MSTISPQYTQPLPPSYTRMDPSPPKHLPTESSLHSWTNTLNTAAQNITRSLATGTADYKDLLQTIVFNLPTNKDSYNPHEHHIQYPIPDCVIYDFEEPLSIPAKRVLNRGKDKMNTVRYGDQHAYIGEGGFGRVFKALDVARLCQRLDSIRINPILPGYKEAVKLAIRDALVAEKTPVKPERKLRQIDPDVREKLADSPYVILPRVETKEMTISALADSDVASLELTRPDTLTLIYYMGVALHDVHERGVILRDLKSEKFVLRDINDLSSVAIIDLDSATLSSEFDQRARTEDTEIKWGTICYFAPEIEEIEAVFIHTESDNPDDHKETKRRRFILRASEHHTGKSLDIFAFGVMCCELLGLVKLDDSNPDEDIPLGIMKKDQTQELQTAIFDRSQLNTSQQFHLSKMIGDPKYRKNLQAFVTHFEIFSGQ